MLFVIKLNFFKRKKVCMNIIFTFTQFTLFKLFVKMYLKYTNHTLSITMVYLSRN